MGRLKVISSGSTGNSYIIEAGGEILLLELGVPFGDILKGWDYDISRVVGCLVTHEHMDHAQSVEKARKYQLKVFTPEELKPMAKYKLGGFGIMPLKVPHGDCKCYSYCITHKDFGSLLFATDLSDFPYAIKGFKHILMECNYADEVVIDNAMADQFSRSHNENHMSLDNCVRILRRLADKSTMTITLLHISRSNGDPELMRARIFEEIGLRPNVAAPGLEVELSVEEF